MTEHVRSRLNCAARYVLPALVLGLYFLALGLGFVQGGSTTRSDDSITYIRPAMAICGIGGYPLSPDSFALRTPGYPLLIAPFYCTRIGDWGVIAFQVLLMLSALILITCAVGTIGARMPVWIVWTAVLLLPLPLLKLTVRILTEAPSAAILLSIVGLVILGHNRQAFLIALFLPFLRPQFSFVPIIVAVFRFWQQSRIKTLAFTLLSLIPVLLLSVCNYVNVGGFSPSLTLGINLSNHTGQWVGLYSGTEHRDFVLRWQKQIAMEGTHIMVGDHFRLDGENWIQHEETLKKISVELIVAYPGRYLESVFRSVLRYAVPILSDSGVSMITGLIYSVSFIFFLITSYVARKHLFVRVAFVLVSLNCLVTSFLEYGENIRYRQPFEPLMYLSIAFVVVEWVYRWRLRQNSMLYITK